MATTASGHEVATTVDYSCFAGAGAFLSTPSDLVRFGMAMSSGKLLQPATVRMLQTPQPLASGAGDRVRPRLDARDGSARGRTHAAGEPCQPKPARCSTSFLTFPERGIVVAVTSNTSYAGTRSIALGIAEAPLRASTTPEDPTSGAVNAASSTHGVLPSQPGESGEVGIGRVELCLVLDGQRRQVGISREVARGSERLQ